MQHQAGSAPGGQGCNARKRRVWRARVQRQETARLEGKGAAPGQAVRQAARVQHCVSGGTRQGDRTKTKRKQEKSHEAGAEEAGGRLCEAAGTGT